MIWTVVNFVILFGGLVFLLRKPMAKSFSDKHIQIKTAIDEAEALRLQVEKMVVDYKAKLSNLDHEVNEVMQEARAAGEQEKKLILERAQKMAEKIHQDALLSAEKEKIHALEVLRKETMIRAAQKAVELLKGKVTEKEHQVFLNELISQTGELHAK